MGLCSPVYYTVAWHISMLLVYWNIQLVVYLFYWPSKISLIWLIGLLFCIIPYLFIVVVAFPPLTPTCDLTQFIEAGSLIHENIEDDDDQLKMGSIDVAAPYFTLFPFYGFFPFNHMYRGDHQNLPALSVSMTVLGYFVTLKPNPTSIEHQTILHVHQLRFREVIEIYRSAIKLLVLLLVMCAYLWFYSFIQIFTSILLGLCIGFIWQRILLKRYIQYLFKTYNKKMDTSSDV